jgi:hypothetical protein
MSKIIDVKVTRIKSVYEIYFVEEDKFGLREEFSEFHEKNGILEMVNRKDIYPEIKEALISAIRSGILD